MSVYVQMHRGTSLFSRLIRWFTRSEYSHVSVWFYSANDAHGGSVIEAMEGHGVRVIPADWYRDAREKGKIELYTLKQPLTADERARLWHILAAEGGAKYDWLGVFRFVTRRRHAHDEKWFCSELVAWGLEQIGRLLFERTASWEVKPGDVPRSPALAPANDPEVAHVG